VPRPEPATAPARTTWQGFLVRLSQKPVRRETSRKCTVKTRFRGRRSGRLRRSWRTLPSAVPKLIDPAFSDTDFLRRKLNSAVGLALGGRSGRKSGHQPNPFSCGAEAADAVCHAVSPSRSRPFSVYSGNADFFSVQRRKKACYRCFRRTRLLGKKQAASTACDGWHPPKQWF
jgi:hypothetical protein